MFLRALQQPRQFAQAETIEDQHGLGAEGFGPPAQQTIRGALDAAAEGLPQIPTAGGEEQIQLADFSVAFDDLAGRVACGQRLAGNFDRVTDDDAPCVGVRTLRQGVQCGSGQCHQSSSFSRFSSKVMPSGSFLSISLSCAPVAVETLMDTSAAFVAGPMPQPSILPIRLSGDVAGFDSGMRGLAVLPSPPKMPPGVGTGGVPPSPPNNPPPLVGAGTGAGGAEPPVAGTAEGSITNTSSRWRPVSESLGRRRCHAVTSSSPGWVCRYSMPRTLMATLPLAHRRSRRSFIEVSPSHGMQSCPAGRGSCSSRSSLPTDSLLLANASTSSSKSSGTNRSLISDFSMASGICEPCLSRRSTLNLHCAGSAKFQRCSTAKRSKRFLRLSRSVFSNSLCSFLYSGLWLPHSCAFISARARMSRSRSRKALVLPVRGSRKRTVLRRFCN